MGQPDLNPKTAAPITRRPAPKYLQIILGCLLGTIILLFIIGIVIGVKSEMPVATTPQVKTEKAAKPKPAAIVKETPTIMANDLLYEYFQNEVAADAKYKGQTVIIWGLVTDIGLDVFDDAYVIVGGNEDVVGIRCSFSDKEKGDISKLARGQMVNVRGKVSGKLWNLLLLECKIQTP